MINLYNSNTLTNEIRALANVNHKNPFYHFDNELSVLDFPERSIFLLFYFFIQAGIRCIKIRDIHYDKSRAVNHIFSCVLVWIVR